jgi:hypothetical protein
MPFAPGHVKSGGRIKGSKNKRTLVLEEMLEKNGFRYVEELIKAYNGEMNDANKMRLQALLQLLPYIVPRLKDMEVTTEEEDDDSLSEEEMPTAKLLEILKK